MRLSAVPARLPVPCPARQTGTGREVAMRCFWCILLAFLILSCANKSTGPKIEPEPITEPELEPEPQYKELSYENLTGGWSDSYFTYSLGTRADSSFYYIETLHGFFRFYEQFSGTYFLNDSYIGIRGTVSIGRMKENPEDRYHLYAATLTDTVRIYESGRYNVDILTLRSVPETYLREILNLSDTMGVTPVVMSMSGEEFSSLLDSLKANTRGRIIQFNNPFQLIRFALIR